MFGLKENMYRTRYHYYKRLRDEAMSKAMEYLLNNDMIKYDKYMERTRQYISKIVTVTKQAEKNIYILEA